MRRGCNSLDVRVYYNVVVPRWDVVLIPTDLGIDLVISTLTSVIYVLFGESARKMEPGTSRTWDQSANLLSSQQNSLRGGTTECDKMKIRM